MDSSFEELVRRRYSCRRYADQAIEPDAREALSAFLAALGAGSSGGPFGTPARFVLLAATEDDRRALAGLGTYGFIKGAPGFIVGAVPGGAKDLEDYGYCLERAVLEATALGLQTCWLGGTFTKSSFARAVGAGPGEVVPAVAAVGHPAPGSKESRMRQRIGAHSRLPWDPLFFDEGFEYPLAEADAGEFAPVLEAVRWSPSASNKQPWRVIRSGGSWHFYLQRTKGYGKGFISAALVKMVDLQRVDMGIAMCHFALVAAEKGLSGRWVTEEPAGRAASPGLEYTATWVGLETGG